MVERGRVSEVCSWSHCSLNCNSVNNPDKERGQDGPPPLCNVKCLTLSTEQWRLRWSVSLPVVQSTFSARRLARGCRRPACAEPLCCTLGAQLCYLAVNYCVLLLYVKQCEKKVPITWHNRWKVSQIPWIYFIYPSGEEPIENPIVKRQSSDLLPGRSSSLRLSIRVLSYTMATNGLLSFVLPFPREKKSSVLLLVLI